MDCTAKQDLLIWQKQYLHLQGLLATQFSTNYFLPKYFQQKLYPKFNFGDFHSLLYPFRSKNIFGHDSWFFIVTSVKTNARKEATRIGEKIYFYVCGFDFDTSHQFSVSICQVQVNVIQIWRGWEILLLLRTVWWSVSSIMKIIF